MAKKIWDEKINKNTDWGGDESTGGLPVSGNRVQEFIKEQLNSKAGVFHYDTTNNRYIVFADEESQDEYFADPTKTELIIGTFDAPFNYSAQITLSSPTYVAILSGTKNNYIDFTFDTINKSGQSVGEDVICTYTIIKGGIKKTVTEKYRYGQAAHFNIDEYLSVGTNTITVGIVGQTTLAATTIGITYQVVDLQLSDTYDISQSYNIVSNPAAAAAIPYAVSGYGTKIMEWYLDGVLLDYVKVEDEIVDVSTTRTKYISLANLSQGIHSLQYRAYTMLDGEKFYSNILYRDLIVYTGANKNPIIAVAATIPVGNEIITSGNLQLFGISQYIPYELNFAVYNPSGVASTDAVIAVDGKLEATIQTHNNEVTTYSLRPTDYGVKTLTITSGTTVYTIGMNVSKSSTSLEPVTDGIQLDLMALGKSNNDVNREEWVYGLYSATFHGFYWNKASGWNNNRLLITSGAYVDINLAPLSPDPTATGKTLEFEFSTANVSDDNAVICDLRNSSGTGLLITASEVILKSAGGEEVSTKFKSEENIRIAFVINKKTGVVNKGLAFIYVNGALYDSVNYAGSDNFTSDKTLRLGNTNLADVQLKALRFYNAALNSDQILNNYILYRDTTEELLSIYDKNAIYEEGTQNFSVDKLAAQCPVFIFTGDIPALENTTDKNKTIYVDVEYINMQDPSRSFTGKGIRLRPQGTSSMGYPKKNFRPYTGYGEVWDNLGNIMVDGLYSFKEGAQPVNVWCLKADYAESSGTHNTGIARLWNQVMYDAQINGEYVLRTEAQKAAKAAGYKYDVRTTVDGFPVNVFYRLTADSELVYIGKYNFNNDKSTESVFGFKDIPGFDNSRMQCWELLNNGNHLALFQDMDNFDTEWGQAYEARYPDKSTNVADLKAFSEWVVSTKGDIEKFKAEKWEHLDVYKVAAYYIYLMRFGAVDQVIKNAMLTSEDGEKFFFINYDNDTIIGVRNDGLLIYNYDIDRQTIDTSFTALVYAYAGHESTLWNNLEADEEFMRIVSEVDNALYIAGLSYEKTIDMFDNQQSGKWCERVYNQDAQYKYIGPYTDSGINNLFMLQGSRLSHRRWWLSHRFDLLDSKYVSGAYKSKSIEFKAANAPAGLEFSIVSGNNIFYGYGLNNEIVESGVRLDVGQMHTFTSRQVINVGDPVRIYSAVNVQELDIHNFIEYLSTLNIAEVFNTTVGTKFKKLVMGVDTTTDSRRNTSVTSISGLKQAVKLENINIAGYKGITSLDLSSQLYLKSVEAKESGISSINIAPGAPVGLLELPATIQSLDFRSLSFLQSANLKITSTANIHTIHIEDCKGLAASADLINVWLNNKTTPSEQCVLFMDNIRWNTDVAFLLKVGQLNLDGGKLTLRGRATITSMNQEEMESLIHIYGEDVFKSSSDFYIKAPDALFITGPSNILEDSVTKYSAIAPGGVEGTFTFSITGTTGSARATITEDGLLTVGIGAGSVQIRCVFRPSDGSPTKVTPLKITVAARTYITSATILGNANIQKELEEYTYKTTPLTPTGEYTTKWELSGDAVDANYISIESQAKDKITIRRTSEPILDTKTSLLKLIINNKNGTIIQESLNLGVTPEGVIITSATHPRIMRILHNFGVASNADYLTIEDAEIVTEFPQVIFFNEKIEDFTEFQYFKNLTTIKKSAFYNTTGVTGNAVKIIIPESVTQIEAYGFAGNLEIPNIKTIVENASLLESRSFDKHDVSDIDLKNLTAPSSTVFNSISGYLRLNIDLFKGTAQLYTLATKNMCKKIEVYSTIPITDANIILTGLVANAENLEELIVDDSIASIGVKAFQGLPKLKEFTLPKNCARVDGDFMPEESKIKLYHKEGSVLKVNEEGNVVTSDTTLFAITSLIDNFHYEMPDSIKTVDSRCCFKNNTIRTIRFSPNLETINSSAFSACSLSGDIVVPDKVTRLGDNCFNSCPNIDSLDLNMVSSMGYYFTNMTNLRSIKISSSFIYYSGFLFGGGVGQVTHIYVDKANPTYSSGEDDRIFYDKTNKVLRDIAPGYDGELTLPEGIVGMTDSNYNVGQKKLKGIIIPESLTSIGFARLGYMPDLSTIIMKSMRAPTLAGSVFGNSDTNYSGFNSKAEGNNILYVPAGATGYDTGQWKDILCNPDKCGFTISYTL